MRHPVAAGTPHLPLRPDDVAVDDGGDHAARDVRDGGEDLFPVGSHLSSAVEAALRMGGCVVAVVLGEAVDQGIEVVGVRRVSQTFDDGLLSHGP